MLLELLADALEALGQQRLHRREINGARTAFATDGGKTVLDIAFQRLQFLGCALHLRGDGDQLLGDQFAEAGGGVLRHDLVDHLQAVAHGGPVAGAFLHAGGDGLFEALQTIGQGAGGAIEFVKARFDGVFDALHAVDKRCGNVAATGVAVARDVTLHVAQEIGERAAVIGHVGLEATQGAVHLVETAEHGVEIAGGGAVIADALHGRLHGAGARRGWRRRVIGAAITVVGLCTRRAALFALMRPIPRLPIAWRGAAAARWLESRDRS